MKKYYGRREIVCSSCGKYTNEAARFCFNCGNTNPVAPQLKQDVAPQLKQDVAPRVVLEYQKKGKVYLHAY